MPGDHGPFATSEFQELTLPVSDVDKSLDFYRDKLGFALDVDYPPTRDFRVVQLTPERYKGTPYGQLHQIQ